MLGSRARLPRYKSQVGEIDPASDAKADSYQGRYKRIRQRRSEKVRRLVKSMSGGLRPLTAGSSRLAEHRLFHPTLRLQPMSLTGYLIPMNMG